LRWAAFATTILVGARLAAAEPADPVAAVDHAAELCKSGNLEAAAGELRALLPALEAEFGPGHAAPQILRVNLSGVERSLGNEAEAEKIGKLPPEDPNAPRIDSKLKRSLRGLAVCATAKHDGGASSAAHATAMPQVTSEDHITLARKLVFQGQYARALDAAKVAKEAAGSSPEPLLKMQIYETLALVRLLLGDRAGALADAQTADDVARSIGAVGVRINVARLVAQAGDLERAGAALQQIAPTATRPEDRAEFDEARGDLDLRLGSPHDALADLDPALVGHQKVYGDGHANTAAVHQLRGDAFRLAGDFPAAMKSYETALQVRRGALGPKHPETARTLNSIGLLQADLRDWRAADDSFESALESLTESQGAEHPETITIRANRALARWGTTGDSDAVDDYAATVTDLSNALGADHPGVALATLNLSRLEAERGHGDRAEQLLQQAMAAQKRTLGDTHPALGQTRLQHGRLLAQRGRLDEASAEVDAAIAIQVKSLGAEHPAVARARITRSRLAVAKGDGAAARREALEASRSIAVYTERTFGAISDRQRSILARDSLDVLGALLSAPPGDSRELYVSMLPHRDSVLRSIAASRAAARGGAGGAFLNELAELRRRYVAAVHGQGPETAERVKLLARQIEGAERMAAAAGSRMFDLDPNEVLSLACKRLPADAVLVKFTAFERTKVGDARKTVPAYSAMVVQGGTCKVTNVDLGSGDTIDKAAESFGSAMRDQRTDQPEARKTLSKALIEPLTAAVGDAARWLVIPDGALWGVPIGALPDPSAPDHYLLERVSVGYLTSTYELADAASTGSGSDDIQRSLLIGAPEFGSSSHGGPVVLTASGPCQVLPFEDLPATSQELEDIRQLIGSTHVVTGVDVTKERFAAELKAKPWLVHFATHAYFAGLGGCRVQQGKK
jgi:tetratricopeptide (TPR) repeat protein